MALLTHTNILKKNANAENGHCKICFYNTEKQEIQYDINVYDPNDQSDFINGLLDLSRQLLLFKAQRNIEYQKLQNISRDTEKDKHVTSNDAYVGINWHDIKKLVCTAIYVVCA